jgi:hypothetical protein
LGVAWGSGNRGAYLDGVEGGIHADEVFVEEEGAEAGGEDGDTADQENADDSD